jgi:flavin reductase (DIM6/NTAB) family NADH-FMN oxidoreductase RutF
MPELGIAERARDIRTRFIDGMSHAAACVNVVTTDGPAGRFGVTVSAMSSISADGERPTVLVCVHHQSRSAAAIIQNGAFCVNVLRDDQSEIADCFAGRSRRDDGDTFGCARWVRESTGALRLADPLAAFDCRVVSAERVGTHHIFIGAVENVIATGAGKALIYANRAFGTTQRIEPATAEPATVKSQLTVGCSPLAAPDMMPELLMRLSALHPQGAATLVENDQHTLVACLKSAEIDVALLLDPGRDSDGSITLLAEWHPYILLPSSHTLAESKAIDLANLVAEPLIELDGYAGTPYCRSVLQTAGIPPQPGMTAKTFDMVRRLVTCGFGYSLLLAGSARVLAQDTPGLVVLPVSTPMAPCRLVLGGRTTQIEHDPMERDFRNICRSYFA